MEIILKKWKIDDTKILANICNKVDRKFLSNRLPSPYTENDAKWWMNMVKKQEGKNGIFRAVIVDGEYVGNISIEVKTDVFCKDAEIGYLLLTNKWSQGIMTEAVKQICEIAFSKLEIVRITGLVYNPNVGSQRVLEKNGFILEGTMKNAIFKNNNIYDLCVYGKYK